MNQNPEDAPRREPKFLLDDAQFAIVVLAVASFTLIIFVLIITLLMT